MSRNRPDRIETDRKEMEDTGTERIETDLDRTEVGTGRIGTWDRTAHFKFFVHDGLFDFPWILH